MMKRILPFLLFTFTTILAYGQCDELFFSEYVEGSGTNKALEIYNPTSSAIQLSGYSVARFSNGSTSLNDDQIIQLPSFMLEPYDVYVIGLDKRDENWTSSQDQILWNGFNLIDTLFDFVTGEPRLDSNGNVILGPQFDDNANALYGTEYNEDYDLQCKVDAFLCPVYDINQTMYFNGNDAMVLLKGTTFDPNNLSAVIDVIGVVGEDPGDAWSNEDGFQYSRNSTLVKNPSALNRNDPNSWAAQLGGTFDFENWTDHFNNDFQYLGIHKCDCDPEVKGNRYSCANGPITGTLNVNSIPFKMFPNPNGNGILTVESDENIAGIQITNLMGQVVLNNSNLSLNKTHSINVNNLETGLYIANIYFNDNSMSIQRLIIE